MSNIKTNHTQVRVRYQGHLIEVDELLAPLLKELWRKGINTYCSCQNQQKSGFGYIVLASPEEMISFNWDKKEATSLFFQIAERMNIWTDMGPDGFFLRFRTPDIKELTKVVRDLTRHFGVLYG